MILNSVNMHNIQHIGIVMDGNGRWAKKRNLPRVLGHHEGVKAVERIVRAVKDLNIPYVSLYAFSTENWSRPKGEVLGLMGLFRYYIKSKVKELKKEDVRLRFSGNRTDLPEDIRALLDEAEQLTATCKSCQMIVCLNYGGRREIIDGINKLLRDDNVTEVTEEMFHDFLYLPDVPDPDLLIRTGGEYRMSNFLLWEAAYSEYYFTDKYWPDIKKEDLIQAVEDFKRRDRRYGQI